MNIEIKKSLTDKELGTLGYYDKEGLSWHGDHSSNASFWGSEVELLHSLLPSGKIIEIGVGAGRDIPLLTQKGYDYTGVEPSQGMLSIAQKQNPHTRLIQASIYDLPFQAHTFDGFWLAAVLLHVPKTRIDEALNSFKRVLKAGAYGFISLKEGEGEEVENDTNRFFSYYSYDEFVMVLTRHGFVVKQYHTLEAAKRIKVHRWLCFMVQYLPERDSNMIKKRGL